MRTLLNKYGPIGAAVFAVIAIALAVFVLAGCAAGTNEEVFSDAEIGDRDTTPAKIIEMPDGFSNVAT